MAADENNENNESPFTRPGFIVSAVVVALVLVLGAILGTLGIVNATRDEPTTAPTVTASEDDPQQSSKPAEEPEPAAGASICGLKGEVLEGTVEEPPAAEWEFQGTIGYPTSSKYGPGKTDENGVRSCFQHSPEGALFMAANAMAQSSYPETYEPWLRYALSEGPNREAMLSEDAEPSDMAGTRVQITGFRVLDYSGTAATIDLLASVTTEGESAEVSAVLHLVWEDGDWRLDSNQAEGVDVGTAPSTGGYTAWEQ
ncbi:hypothetical protein [Brachybacterium sp. UNK5269]|uniref:hypothetical protein n=1 Tax=Brachybacterium sp. UNK5269 TaxID=3408576 RepID=UPI003BAEE683